MHVPVTTHVHDQLIINLDTKKQLVDYFKMMYVRTKIIIAYILERLMPSCIRRCGKARVLSESVSNPDTPGYTAFCTSTVLKVIIDSPGKFKRS